jgi:hypothetical protein
MKIEGNQVPHLSYKNITFSSGKANFVAIMLLTLLVPSNLVRDEDGDVIRTWTKFNGDAAEELLGGC